jgi:hypothetical protein
MISKTIAYYFNLLVDYVWLGIFTTIYFVIVMFFVPFFPNIFYIFFAISAFGFFVLLFLIGSNTYRYLSKFDKMIINFLDEDKKNEAGLINSPRKNSHAPETVFYRIYEVVAAFSIYEASKGVIFSILVPNAEITPLNALFQDPQEFLMFLIFIVMSIQFIVGVSRHFESDFSFLNHMNIYAIINYVLIVGEAVSLLAMGISVSYGNFALFSLWFIALLVIDYFWILLFKILRAGGFGLKKAFGLRITDLESTLRIDLKVNQIVNKYWIGGNIAFIIYLSIMEPVAKGYIALPEIFFNVYLSLMFVGVLISTFVNSKCLSALERIQGLNNKLSI